MAHEDVIVGIDLGTTFSSVAVVQDGQPRLLSGDRGERLVPSVVGVDATGTIIVGQDARNQAVAFPERTIRSIKRRMGEDVRLPLAQQTYSPPEVSSLILRRLAQIAGRRLGHDVRRTIITVPAYFSDAQRLATRQAGELAGLEVVRILNEPTAAGLVYGLERDADRSVLVFDFGGGTLDCSILQIRSGVIEVRATHGDTHLGGDDIDRALVDRVAEGHRAEHGIDLRDDRRALARLLRAAERAKIDLSTCPFTTIQEEFIAKLGDKALHLNREVSRHELEDLVGPLLDRAVACVDRCLEDAHLTRRDLDRVLLVGGSSRIPMVGRRLEDHLDIEASMRIDPEACVAMGAACEAATFAGHDVGAVLVDICAHSLGVRVLGAHDGVYDTDCMSVIIPRNTPIPTARAEVYATVVPNQSCIEVDVYQGEASKATRNDLIGSFTFSELSRGPSGQPVLLGLDYDLDGIVRVTATDKMSARSLSVTMRDPRRSTPVGATPAPNGLPAVPASASGRRALIDRARELAGSSPDPVVTRKLLDLIERLEALMAQAPEATPASAPDPSVAIRVEEDLADLVYEAEA